MQNPARHSRCFSWAPIVVLLLISSSGVAAQTYTVLHDFTGGQDGASP
jgi:hypothetical protein